MPKSVICAIIRSDRVRTLPLWILDSVFPNTVSGRNEGPVLALVSGDELFIADYNLYGTEYNVYDGSTIYRFSMLDGSYDTFGVTNQPSSEVNPSWASSLRPVIERYVNVVGHDRAGRPMVPHDVWKDPRPGDQGRRIAHALFTFVWAREECDGSEVKFEQILHKQVGWGDDKFRFHFRGPHGTYVERKVEESWSPITLQEFLTLIITQ